MCSVGAEKRNVNGVCRDESTGEVHVSDLVPEEEGLAVPLYIPPRPEGKND